MKIKVYKLLIVTIIFLKIPSEISAQILFGKKLEGMECVKPCECYKSPSGVVENEKCNLCKQSKQMPGKSKDSRYWIVYSDREDNPTYTDQNFLKPTGITLSFMQPCYAAQESGNSLRLVRIPLTGQFVIDNKGKDAAVFKNTAEDLGWVDKNKLLLWQNSLIDDSTTFAKKAVSVKRLVEKSQTISEYINKKGHSILDLFNAPVPEEKNDLDKELKMFQYLYIYKEENNMYLLGKSNEVTVQTALDDMLGWAPKNQVHTWKDALCLRINFDEEARADRLKNNFDVKFFGSPDKARLYKKGQDVTGLPFLYDDPTDLNKKDNPYLLGYPIIDGRDYKENIYRTGYITNTVNDKGQLLYPVSEQAENDKKISAAQNQKDNINIVFVLDGKSKAIINKIADAMDQYPYWGNKDQSRNDYSVSAIIYCGETDELQPVKPTSSKDDFVSRLHKIANDESSPCNVNRETEGAPLYGAIKRACTFFKDNGTTNVIIYAGDVADNNSSLKNDVIKELINKQVKMLFIQVTNKNGASYDNFLTDTKELMIETSEGIDNTFFKRDIEKGVKKKVSWDCKTNSDHCELLSTAVPGLFYSKPRGQNFKPNEIKDCIVRFILANENKINALIRSWNSNNSSNSNEASALDESTRKEFEMYYKTLGYGDKDVQNFLSGNTYKIFIEGYTTLTSSVLKYNIFHKTLFLSDREFGRLKNDFEHLGGGGTPDEAKDAIVASYKSIIKAYKGGSISEKQFSSYTFNDLLSFISHLPVNNKLFDMQIEKIKVEKDEEKVRNIVKSFKIMYKKLELIEKDPYCMYEDKDRVFYWVKENTFHIDD